MLQRHVFLLVLDIEQHGVALVEGAAAAILSAHADGNAGLNQSSEGQRFGHAVVHRAFACAHLGPLFEQLFHLGMDMESSGEVVTRAEISRSSSAETPVFNFILRLVSSAFVVSQ